MDKQKRDNDDEQINQLLYSFGLNSALQEIEFSLNSKSYYQNFLIALDPDSSDP